MAGARQVALGHRHSRRPVASHAHVRVQAAAVLQRASAQPHGRGPFPAGRPSSSDGQSDRPAVAEHLRLSAVAPAAAARRPQRAAQTAAVQPLRMAASSHAHAPAAAPRRTALGPAVARLRTPSDAAEVQSRLLQVAVAEVPPRTAASPFQAVVRPSPPVAAVCWPAKPARAAMRRWRWAAAASSASAESAAAAALQTKDTSAG